MSMVIVAGMIALGWLCLMGGLVWILWGPERQRGAATLRRMQALSGRAAASEQAPVAAPQGAAREATRASTGAKTGAKTGAATGASTGGATPLILRSKERAQGRKLPVFGDLGLLLQRGDVTMRPAAFLAACFGAALSLALLFALKLPLLASVGLGLALGVLGPVAVLKHRHQKRVAAFTAQLPDALELMMRGLRVGHPVSVTIANVARTMPDPIGSEFARLCDQITHGDYLTDAFKDLADRMGQEDMDYLAVSLSIQHGTGGNLAQMLGVLAKVIRDRILMRRRVKAISAEGRMSAILLSSLPVLIYLATTLGSPNYYADVSGSEYFRPIATVIVALVLANGLLLNKLVRFEI